MSLEPIRTKIDEIDTAFLALLSLRMEQSKKLKQLKAGKNIEDKSREETLRRKWRLQAKALGLDEEFAITILEMILIESKRIQSTKD